MTSAMDPLIQNLTAPISDARPVGINIRYDDEFEFIEDELAKQGALVDRGQVNWDMVSQSAINLLCNKSKDLKVSCYLIRALYEQQGFKGLAAGLLVNLQLLENFWDDLFPERTRARSNAYEWLGSKFQTLLLDIEILQQQIDYIQQSYDTVLKIEKILNHKLDNDAPVLGHFRRSLKELLETGKQQADGPAVESQSKPESAAEINNKKVLAEEQARTLDGNTDEDNIVESATISTAKFTKTPDSTEQAINSDIQGIQGIKDRNKIIRQCHEAMRNLSMWSLKDSLDCPSAYAMNRFSTWMGINQLPMHNNKVTPLRPLPKDKINAYIKLFDGGNYSELIPQVELSFSKSPFWLDAHRMVAQALEALKMYDSAMIVRDYTALFIKRFPEIINLKFSDNSNFADAQTRHWITTQLLGSYGNDKIPETDEAEENDYHDILAQVSELSRQNKIKEAVQLFKIQINQQASPKKQIFWKYYLAKFCYDNGYYKLSIPLLQEIDRFIKTYNLESWEPDLVKNVVYLLITCLRQIQPYTDINEVEQQDSENIKPDSDNVVMNNAFVSSHPNKEVNELFSRLCHLDPLLALEIG